MNMGFEEAARRHREQNRQGASVRHQLHRMAAIEHYGPSCEVCGDERWNTAQVVPHGGARWRDAYPDPPRKGARNKYAWLVRRGFPQGFALVCGITCRTVYYRTTTIG